MASVVMIDQWVKAYEKDPADTSHVGWLAHLVCGHSVKYDPTKFSNYPYNLPTIQRCSHCADLARKTLEAHGIG